MISDAIEAVNTDFDLERLREIDHFLRNLPDSEATLDDVAQMLDVITAWELGGRYREALPIATKALRRARELNDPMLLHKALNARARVADGAMGILERRQEELSKEQFSYLRCATLCWVADFQVQLGNCGAAVTAAQLSREIGKGRIAQLTCCREGASARSHVAQ
jgi:hypothetical protein